MVMTDKFFIRVFDIEIVNDLKKLGYNSLRKEKIGGYDCYCYKNTDEILSKIKVKNFSKKTTTDF